MKSPRHTSLILVVSSIFLLLLLSLLSSLLSLGQQLSGVHPFLGGLFYLLIAVCFGAGILYPILHVWQKPIFSMYMLRDRDGRARQRWCRKLTDNLIRNTDLSEEEKALLPGFLEQGNEADDLLIAFFQEKFSPIIDKEITASAKAAFMATAISQTALYDMLSMLSINLHQIRAIVEACGYRPSGPALFGLYARVLKATFVAGGMEEMDLEEILPMITGNAALKLPGLVLASAAQGTVNAFTTIRVGIITKKYLFSADGPVSMKQARKESYKEALALLKVSGLYKDLFDLLSKKAESARDAAAGSVKKAWNHVRPGKEKQIS